MSKIPLFAFERCSEFSLEDTLKVLRLTSKALDSVAYNHLRRLIEAPKRPRRALFIAPIDTAGFVVKLGTKSKSLFRSLELHLSTLLLGRAPSSDKRVSIPGLSLEESLQPTEVQWGVKVPKRSTDTEKPSEFLTAVWVYRRQFEPVGEQNIGGALGIGHDSKQRYHLVAVNMHQDSRNVGVSSVTLVYIFENDHHRGGEDANGGGASGTGSDSEAADGTETLVDVYWNVEVGANIVRIAAQSDDLPERMMSCVPSVFAHLFMFKPGFSALVPKEDGDGKGEGADVVELPGGFTVDPALTGRSVTQAGRKEDVGAVKVPMEQLTRFDIVNANLCPWTMVDLVEIVSAAQSVKVGRSFADEHLLLFPTLAAVDPTLLTAPLAAGGGGIGANAQLQQVAAAVATLKVIDRQFFHPFASMVRAVTSTKIYQVKEEEADLTTPKGIWRCKTGLGIINEVELNTLWSKKSQHYHQMFTRFWKKGMIDLFSALPLGTMLSLKSDFDRFTLQKRRTANLKQCTSLHPAATTADSPPSTTTAGGGYASSSPEAFLASPTQSIGTISISGLSAFELALPGQEEELGFGDGSVSMD